MRILIIGAGRVGARLANTLHSKHHVTIVDINDLAFRRLDPEFSGETIRGNGIDVDLLRSAGATSADVVIAVTNGDNRNLMAAQVAKTIFGVEKVLARVYDPVRSATFQEMGLQTICPTVKGAERLFQAIVRA